MAFFFAEDKVRNELERLERRIKEKSYPDGFIKERNGKICSILRLMISNPDVWDKRTPFNIEHISNAFMDFAGDEDVIENGLNMVFAILLRFSLEEHINNSSELSNGYQSLTAFAVDNLKMFDEASRAQVNFALHSMHLAIFRKLITSSNFKVLQDFTEAQRSAEQLKNDWDIIINEKEQEVKHLQDILNSQKHAFNFVGLYAGFESLGRVKDEQLIWARRFLLGLGTAVPVMIIISSIYFIFFGKGIASLRDLVPIIPSLSLSLILIYYFRVALANYNNIRAQIVQIDLRKSLCQFIQNYAEYSSKIKTKDSNLLDKFEDIIFSNIMPSEDKIPSSFDGLEQIASLINVLKGKG